MRKITILLLALGVALLGFVVPALAVEPAEAEVPDVAVLDILAFDTLVPVYGPFLGDAYPIRGVPGASLPWILSEASGVLSTDGMLSIDVKGLVLADDPMVPAEHRLINPVAGFRGAVSCLTVDDMGKIVKAYVATDVFEATLEGDVKIDGHVMLPKVCVAPIIFVTTPHGKWVAITGS